MDNNPKPSASPVLAVLRAVKGIQREMLGNVANLIAKQEERLQVGSSIRGLSKDSLGWSILRDSVFDSVVDSRDTVRQLMAHCQALETLLSSLIPAEFEKEECMDKD